MKNTDDFMRMVNDIAGEHGYANPFGTPEPPKKPVEVKLRVVAKTKLAAAIYLEGKAKELREQHARET